MHVILDSNIYLGDPKFQGQVNILGDYLKATGGQAVLPNIVLAEAEIVYQRQLNLATEKMIEGSKDVRRLADGFELPIVNINMQVIEFTKRIKAFPENSGQLSIDLTVPKRWS
jgi:hypothetical protein